VRPKLAVIIWLSLCSSFLPAQTGSLTAFSIIAQSLVQLTGGQSVHDVSLSGTVGRTISSESDSGTILLRGVGVTESRIDFGLSSGLVSEIRTSGSGDPQGFWTSTDRSNQPFASHNCYSDAVWFFPALTIISQLSIPGVTTNYVGQESLDGIAVYHLVLQKSFPDLEDTENNLIGPWTTEHFYIDSKTLLPVAITFFEHPDNNANTDIPIRIEFSGYQTITGFKVPQQIIKYVNGVKLYDIQISSSQINSGLSASTLLAQ